MKIVFWLVVVLVIKMIIMIGGPALLMLFDAVSMIFILYKLINLYGLNNKQRISFGIFWIALYLFGFYYLIPYVIENELLTKMALEYDYRIQLLVNAIALGLGIPVSNVLASNNASIKKRSGF